MINKEKIVDLLNEYDTNNQYFIVECKIGGDNKISLLADSLTGISIKECVQISRFIESNLDREEEDFALDVSSPGLDASLKVPQQYEKNVGRELKVITEDKNLEGTLTKFENDEITLEYEALEKQEGRKRKVKVQHKEVMNINDIKTAKVVISFK